MSFRSIPRRRPMYGSIFLVMLVVSGGRLVLMLSTGGRQISSINAAASGYSKQAVQSAHPLGTMTRSRLAEPQLQYISPRENGGNAFTGATLSSNFLVMLPDAAARPAKDHPTLSPTKSPVRFIEKSRQQQQHQAAAIKAYRLKVELSNHRSQHCASSRTRSSGGPEEIRRYSPTGSITANRALECLQLTTPTLSLAYPVDDAEKHFNEIRYAMAPWAQHATHRMHKKSRYEGPWIENQWITAFESLMDNQDNHTCLNDHFGPFVPIFLPWVDHWVGSRFQYPEGFLDTLRSVLRPNVPYVTVSQSDVGLHELGMAEISNLLVLSAGGYGHVPIPLLKQPELQNNYIDIANRTIGVSYVGSLKNAPHAMRRELHQHLRELNSTLRYEHYYGDAWRKSMAESRFSLVPRGYGRTAYHLMEALQMGLVPVHVYSDIPWVPYADLFRQELGFVTDLHGLDQLIAGQLERMTTADLRQRERRIVELRTSHFSFEGALEQIKLFLNGGDSDLRCQKLPGSARDA